MQHSEALNIKIHDVQNTSLLSKGRISLPDFSVLSTAPRWNCTTLGLSLESSPANAGKASSRHPTGELSLHHFIISKSSRGGPSPQSSQVCVCMTELPRNTSLGRFDFVVAMCLGKWKEVPASAKGGAYFKVVVKGARWASNGSHRCVSHLDFLVQL